MEANCDEAFSFSNSCHLIALPHLPLHEALNKKSEFIGMPAASPAKAQLTCNFH